MTPRPQAPRRSRDLRTGGAGARHRAAVRRRAGLVALLRPLRPTVRGTWALTGVVALAVVVGGLGAGGTYALYSQSVATPAGTVRSGQASLTVSASTLSLAGLVPGASATATTTVANTGDARLALTVAASGLTSAYEAVPGSSLDALTLRVTPVRSASACAAGLTGGATAPLRSWATPRATGVQLAPRTPGTTPTQVLCLEVALAPGAPVGVQGAVDAFDVVVTGTQVRA